MPKRLFALFVLILAAALLSSCTGTGGSGSGISATHDPRLRGRNQLLAATFADMYIVPTTNNQQTDISGETADVVSLPFGQTTAFQTVLPGQYEFVFTQPGTKTVVARGIVTVVQGDTVTGLLQNKNNDIEVG